MNATTSLLTRILTCITTLTLFAALAIPVRVAAQHTRYKLIDLGTLGGPASYLPGPPPVVKVLNSQGTVAGYGDTSTPDPFPAACFNKDCFVSHAFQWRNGVKTDLGALVAGWSSAIMAISDAGLIVGFAQNGLIDPLFGPEPRAVLWKDGQIIDLGTFGGDWSLAAGVNSRGQVVGAATNKIADPLSGVGTQQRAFVWQNGVMRDLGTLGGPDAFAILVNERGQVAGTSLTSDTIGPSGSAPTDSFLWQNGQMTDLGTLGGTLSAPNDINNRGQVVGLSNLAGDPGCPHSCQTHPFLWDHGVLTDLGTLGGDNGQATALNDKAEVVGYADLPGSTSHHAFFWKDGTMTDLGVLEGQSDSAAWFISSKGQIVGHSHDCVSASRPECEDAVLWENGGPPINLNTRVANGSALHTLDAYYINDRGEIAGYGVLPGCAPQDFETCGHVYVLIPCGEVDEGCDIGTDDAAAATQNLAPVNDATTTSRQPRSAPSGAAAAWRAQLARRYHIPGRGASKD